MSPTVPDLLRESAAAELERRVRAELARRGEAAWTPLPGPQTAALESAADELYYGGGAGGGKSDLLLGYGLTRGRHGIIFRRQFKQLLGPEGLIERSKAIVGQPELFNHSALVWRLGGRMLEFGAVEHEDDKAKYAGRAHDFKAFDELPQFSESQYLFLGGWARTTVVGQRVRIIACGNPPQDAEGEWIIRRWAPWLDEQHPTPAEPGELRWFVRTRGNDEVEVAGPEPVTVGGETLHPRSRTFIPARVQDNPYLMATDYLARLQQLPEPLRSQLIYGDHTVGLQDDPWQMIPTAWVRQAQARWTSDGAYGRPATGTGIDVAQGGNDETVIARRHGTWFAELEQIPGDEVPDANANAEHVTRALIPGGWANIDVDGIGAATYFLARAQHGERAGPTPARTRPTCATRAVRSASSTSAPRRTGSCARRSIRRRRSRLPCHRRATSASSCVRRATASKPAVWHSRRRRRSENGWAGPLTSLTPW